MLTQNYHQKMILQKLYQEYLADFDPTPQFAYDDYLSPLDFEDWLEEFHPNLLNQK